MNELTDILGGPVGWVLFACWFVIEWYGERVWAWAINDLAKWNTPVKVGGENPPPPIGQRPDPTPPPPPPPPPRPLSGYQPTPEPGVDYANLKPRSNGKMGNGILIREHRVLL